MSKKVIYALILMGLTVLVLIFNRGNVDVNLLFKTVHPLKSLAMLAFTVIGVVIGILLK